MRAGSRNLFILGVASCLVALATAGVSLAIYHNTGDIYLDRSRPGFLPDKEEIEQQDDIDDDEEYKMPSTGSITKGDLDKYIEELEEELEELDKYVNPFNTSSLSDEKLGIQEK